jgi:RimJ/RimL family protein N-acetyltransferase
MPERLELREITDDDLPIFFAQQLDPEANAMAAFGAKDPSDPAPFHRHWKRIRGDAEIILRTVVVDDAVAGYVASFHRSAGREVSYWLGRDFWGRGLATRALAAFVAALPMRPLHARVAQDNLASRRVLEKCGFVVTGSDRGFASARDATVDEWLLTLAS